MSDYLSTVIQQARDWDYDRARSQQKEAGWSDMSGCRAYLGFIYRGEWATDDTDKWRAISGTSHHTWMTDVRRAACAAEGVDAAFEGDPEISVAYRGVPGHADEINYTDGVVTDWKFPALKSARFWSDPQVLDEKFVQPHGYGAAVIGTPRWIEAAKRAGRDPRQVTVQLLVAPVDGTFDDWTLFTRALDVAVADAAVDRYEYVREASDRGDELPKDKELYWCRRWCEFSTACRGPVRDGEARRAVRDPRPGARRRSRSVRARGRSRVGSQEGERAGRGGHPRAERHSARLESQHVAAGQAQAGARSRHDPRRLRNSDVELPMTWDDGSSPRLSVTRVNPDKPPRGSATRAPSPILSCSDFLHCVEKGSPLWRKTPSCRPVRRHGGWP